jgi:hypothetical protein
LIATDATLTLCEECMKPPLPPLLFAFILFIGMLVMLEIGRRYAIRHQRDGESAEKGSLGTIETAVFALFGLLIAFTFSGAAARFQEKRMMIADEASSIDNAYMCLELLSPQARPGIQELFRQYIDARLEIYDRLPDMEAAAPMIERSHELREEIWRGTSMAMRLPNSDPGAGRLILPAITAMFRDARERMISLQNHPPLAVYMLLFALGLLCSLLAGFRMASRFRRSVLHMVCFALVTAGVVYITMDIEYPRIGLIQLENADQFLKEVRAEMK